MGPAIVMGVATTKVGETAAARRGTARRAAARGAAARRAAARGAAIAALGIAALGSAGCRDRDGKRQEAAAPAVAWTASCGPALQGLANVPAAQRVAAVLAACPVCAAGPLLRDRRGLQRTPTYLTEVGAAMEACGGFCNRLAGNDFLRGLQHQADEDEVSSRPWRALAEACPVELGERESSRNFIGATWFLLERIAIAAGRELAAPLAAAAPFPLPAVSERGRGLLLPPAPVPPPSGGRVVLVLPGRLAVTVLGEITLVGRLPWGRLTAAGVEVDGDYPGERAEEQPDGKTDGKPDGLTAALAAQQLLASLRGGPADDAPVTLLAPLGLPAQRVADVLRRLDRPARLAVLPASTLPEYEPPMALPPKLHRPDGEATDAQLALGDEEGLAAAAKLLAGDKLTLVAGKDDTVAQLALALAHLPGGVAVQLVAAPPVATNPPPAK